MKQAGLINKIIVSILFFTFPFLQVKSFAQETVTAEQVIQRFIKVSGGEKYLNSLKATGATAKGVLNGDSVKVYMIKSGNNMYMKFETASYGVIETAYSNGKVILKKDGEVMPITDSSAVEGMQSNAFVLAELSYQPLGYQLKLLPTDMEGYYKVEVLSPKGRRYLKYYDKETGYLYRIVSPDGATSYFSDYFTKDGFTLSRREKTINANGMREEITITEFMINPKFDASIFDF